jgi:hypothetical protein
MTNRWVFLAILLLAAFACKGTPASPEPPPGPTEKLVGKLFWHDLVAGQYDIFMADLYIVPKTSASFGGTVAVRFRGADQGRFMFSRGVSKFETAEIDGLTKERVVVNALASLEKIDISQYDFVLRNIINLTEPTSNDFAVAVNSQNWIAWVKDPDLNDTGTQNWQIFYMNVADRVQHQLTPINGQYSGDNVDPDWKDDNTIVWVHNWRAVEVNLSNLNNVADTIPDWKGSELDPTYSPDHTMILFNTWQGSKKNGYIKYIQTGVFDPVLPHDYFVTYSDDNPTWVFSNSLIVGHVFIGGKGRIYTRDLQNAGFSVITGNQHDFRYVTPVKLETDIYFVFSDWDDPNRPTLWISNKTGTDIRELNQPGDEAVFQMLGLPVPNSQEDLERTARDYSLRFAHSPS